MTAPVPALMLLPVNDMLFAFSVTMPPPLLIDALAGILIDALASAAMTSTFPPDVLIGLVATNVTPAGPSISTAPFSVVIGALRPML